jgi:uncharacterized protein (DUF2141 family)
MFARLALLAAVLLVVAPARAGDLRLTIDGVRSDAGALMIGLYSTREGYEVALDRSAEPGRLNDPVRLIGVALRATPGAHTVVFADLPPGRYAVIAFHDENDDGRMNKRMAVPTEGYGFSNNAQGFLKPPSFEAAAVAVADAPVAAKISLVYPSRPQQSLSDGRLP